MKHFRAAALLVVLSISACRKGGDEGRLLPRAELGVFYGGQVQERIEVEMPPDVGRPTIGFRLSFPEPLTAPATVRWEVDMPGPARRRVTRVAQATLEPGQSRFDRVIEVPRSASLGLWNVRVQVGDELAIDRALLLFEPGKR